MDWKEFFRPKLKTVLISIIVTIIIGIIIINLLGPRICPSFCPDLNLGPNPSIGDCPKWPNLIDTCCDNCRDFQEFIGETFFVFVLPFVIVYLITSLIHYFVKK